MRGRGRLARGAALLLACGLSAWGSAEPESLSDSADSLDFERFHAAQAQGKPLIDLGGPPAAQSVPGVNVFDRELDNPSGKGSVRTEELDAPAAAGPLRDSRPEDAPGPPPPAGAVMNIRVRYTLTRSDHTPFLAHTAIHALHSYIVDHCPQGWIKLAEWTRPVEDDWFLYYQFRCVAR